MRNAVFTLNGYDEDDVARLLLTSEFSYICFGKEVGANGNPHLQGYCELARQTSFSVLKRLISPECHLERRRGTQDQAIAYTRKDNRPDDWYSAGSPSEQGRRTDLESIRLEIDAGATDQQLAEDHFNQWCYHRNSWSEYRRLRSKPRDPEFPPEVYYYWGDTGTGKSKQAYDLYPDAFYQMTGTKWFGGYDNMLDKVMIFDDYDPAAFSIREFISLIDRYPRKVEIKGGWCEFKPDIIVITNNMEPSMLYPDEDPRLIEAMLRRITEVVHFQ